MSTGWIGTKFGTDIHDSRTMNPNDFGDPLTFFPHAPPQGSYFLCFIEMSQQL